MSGDEEALAEVIGSAGRLGHVYIDGNDGCLAAAAAVLASEWLADHDAAVRAAERDRVLAEVAALFACTPHALPPEKPWWPEGCFHCQARERLAALASASGTPEEGKASTVPTETTGGET